MLAKTKRQNKAAHLASNLPRNGKEASRKIDLNSSSLPSAGHLPSIDLLPRAAYPSQLKPRPSPPRQRQHPSSKPTEQEQQFLQQPLLIDKSPTTATMIAQQQNNSQAPRPPTPSSELQRPRHGDTNVPAQLDGRSHLMTLDEPRQKWKQKGPATRERGSYPNSNDSLQRSQSENDTTGVGHHNGDSRHTGPTTARMASAPSCLSSSVKKSHKAASLERSQSVKFAVEALESINKRRASVNNRKMNHSASMPPMMMSAELENNHESSLKSLLEQSPRRKSEGDDDLDIDDEPSPAVYAPVESRGTRRTTISYEQPLEHGIDLARGGDHDIKEPVQEQTGINSRFVEGVQTDTLDNDSSIHSSELIMEPTRPLEDGSVSSIQSYYSLEGLTNSSEGSVNSDQSYADSSVEGAIQRGLLAVIEQAQQDLLAERTGGGVCSSMMTVGPSTSSTEAEQNTGNGFNRSISWGEIHHIASTAQAGEADHEALDEAHFLDRDSSGYSLSIPSLDATVDGGMGASHARFPNGFKETRNGKSEACAQLSDSQSEHSVPSAGGENSYHFSDESSTSSQESVTGSKPNDKQALKGVVGPLLKCNSLNTAGMKLALESTQRHSSMMNLHYQSLQSPDSQIQVGNSPIMSVDDNSAVDSFRFRNRTKAGVDSCASSFIDFNSNYDEKSVGNSVGSDDKNPQAPAPSREQKEMQADNKNLFMTKNDSSQRPKPNFRRSMTAITSEAKRMLSEPHLQRRDSMASKISRPKYRRTLTSRMSLEHTYNKSTNKKSTHPKTVRETIDFRCKDNGAFGFYTGTIDEENHPHGHGKMVYDDGHIIKGIWSNGKLIIRESYGKYKPNQLPGYSLGEMGQKRDMASLSKEEAVVACWKLHVGDCAFICRSDMTWSYAIVKSRSDSDDNLSITFQVDSQGSIKVFRVLQFATHVRLPKKPDLLHGFSIGDVGKEDDMVIHVGPAAAKSASRLRINDAAFIQRSNGSWRYAIVKDRSDGDGDDEEATITFQVDKEGSFKVAKRSVWGSFVRCVKVNKRITGLTEEESKVFVTLVSKAKSHLCD